jgi:hypothetical protein
VIEAQVAVPREAAAEPAPVVSPAPQIEPAAPVDIDADLQQAGLVMIETAATSVAVPVEPLEPKLGRKPKAPMAIAEEPLQMVETRRD